MVIAPTIGLKHCLSMTGYSFFAWNLALLCSFPLELYGDVLRIPMMLPLVVLGIPSSLALVSKGRFCCALFRLVSSHSFSCTCLLLFTGLYVLGANSGVDHSAAADFIALLHAAVRGQQQSVAAACALGLPENHRLRARHWCATSPLLLCGSCLTIYLLIVCIYYCARYALSVPMVHGSSIPARAQATVSAERTGAAVAVRRHPHTEGTD